MYYFTYETTNKINGKVYGGAHKTDNLADGYLGSGTLLKKAIQKYGKHNFERKDLAFFQSPEEMFEAEAELVNEDYVARKDTYNIKKGGMGGFDYVNVIFTKERRLLVSRSGMKGKHHTKSAKEKLRLANVGKKLTEEHKKKISEKSSLYRHTKETKEKLSKLRKGCIPWNKGKIGIYSEEYKNKIRQSVKKYHQNIKALIV